MGEKKIRSKFEKKKKEMKIYKMKIKNTFVQKVSGGV